MASENQSNKRSSRLQSKMESNMSTLPEKPDLVKIEESKQLQGMKRKADINLTKQHGVKRFALGNLTNAESDNLPTQKPHKATLPMAKAKQSNDSKIVGSKNKGVSKILTRAATRLEKAFSNVKKLPEGMEGPEDALNVENSQHSSLSAEFAKITVGVDAELKPEIAQATTGIPRDETAKTQQKKSSHPLLVRYDEKNAKLLPELDTKNKGRLSIDSELSDNSLYVSAIETETDSNLSTANLAEKISGMEGKVAIPPTKSQAAPALQVKWKIVTEKPATITSSSLMAKQTLIPVQASSKNLGTAVTNNNDHKKMVGPASDINTKKQTSSEMELNDETLYISAIDTSGEDASTSSGQISAIASTSSNDGKTIAKPQLLTAQTEQLQSIATVPVSESTISTNTKKDVVQSATGEPHAPPKRTPHGVEDFDKTYWNDVYLVSEYAQDIFDYLRQRESVYVVKDYMQLQPHISHYMRALLVDWMVEIQESFELNHETLYLAVKIVDSYLSRVVIERDSLQVVAAAGLLIAAKYDERVPPTVDDFVYICDGAYERPELLRMERIVFRTIGYDLGFPLSYRFLRRYARVTRVPMPILTLARYVLETSLMDYTTVVLADSKLACASLFIALRMSHQPGWNKGLEFYTGYKVADFKDIVILLNNGITVRKPEAACLKLTSVREKYSHELFFHVAKRPVITNLEKLFAGTDVLFKVPAAVGAPSTAQSSKTNDAAKQ